MRTVLITGTSQGSGCSRRWSWRRAAGAYSPPMRDLDRKGPLLAALGAAGAAQRGRDQPARRDAAGFRARRGRRDAACTGGLLDAVVQNAGVAAGGAFEDLPDEDVRRVMETNFFGVLDADARAAADVPRAADRSHPHRVERGGVHGPAGQLDLLRLEVGDRRLGRGHLPSSSVPSASRSCWLSPGLTSPASGRHSPRISPEGSAYRPWVQYVFRAGEAHCRSAAATRRTWQRQSRTSSRRSGRRSAIPSVGMARIAHFLRGKLPSTLLRTDRRPLSRPRPRAPVALFSLNELPGSRLKSSPNSVRG